MRGPHSRAARRALELYSGAPPGDRLHTVVRWWSAPFAAVESRVPLAGRVVEIGCGHGLFCLYLALCSPSRRVLGVDVDADKVAIATAAAGHLAPGEANVRFEPIGQAAFPEGEFDAIVIVDVLYLLGPEARSRLLDDCVGHLAPGGVLLVKEIDLRPRWKAKLAVLQERMATGVLGITEGDHVAFAEPAELVGRLHEHGLAVLEQRLDRGYPHPHLLIEARRGARARA